MSTETKHRRRARNSGCAYLREDSKIYWLRHKNLNGKMVQVSSGTSDKQKALSMLRTKVAKRDVGEYEEPKAHLITVREIVEFSLSLAESKQRRNVEHDRGIWEGQLKPALGHLPALGLLNGKVLLDYKNQKLGAGDDSDTVNNHFSILRVAFNRSSRRLGGQHPDWKQLYSPKTDNPECLVSIEDDVLPRLCSEAGKVGVWCRALVELACNFGWRKNAWLNLKVAQVDLLRSRITLPGDLSKNGEPYTAYFTKGDVVHQLLHACVAGKGPEDYVLTRETKQGHKPIKSFCGTWRKITQAAGIPLKPATKGKSNGQLTRAGIRFHNTRNTAATRMIEADIPQAEAMDIAGWETDSIFRHYHITKDKRKMEAAEKMAARRTQSQTTVSTTGEYDEPSPAPTERPN